MEKIEVPSKIGDVASFSAHGKKLVVKKKSATSWTAYVVGTKTTRWGDKKEIREDIQHFLDTGTLPRSSGQSWASAHTQELKMRPIQERLAGAKLRGTPDKPAAFTLKSTGTSVFYDWDTGHEIKKFQGYFLCLEDFGKFVMLTKVTPHGERSFTSIKRWTASVHENRVTLAAQGSSKTKALSKALVDLMDAFGKVDDLWDDDIDALNDGYPFADSFDEVANDVMTWVQKCRRELNKVKASADVTAGLSKHEDVLRSTFFPPDLYGGTKLFLTFNTKDGQYAVRSKFQDYYSSLKGLVPNTPAARKALDVANKKFEALLLGKK